MSAPFVSAIETIVSGFLAVCGVAAIRCGDQNVGPRWAKAGALISEE